MAIGERCELSRIASARASWQQVNGRKEREREKKGGQNAGRDGGIHEREGRETGAPVGGDEVTPTPRRGGSLGNLRELAATTDSVRFGVLAIDSQARRAVDGARSRVCMRNEYDVRPRYPRRRNPRNSRRRGV